MATNRDSPFLTEALRSVREQTMAGWELLIVDNGLANPEVVRELIADDPRMQMIRIDSSANAGSARNVGVARTKGRLVTYLDDDDVWAPERLQRHVEVHANHPMAPASYSGYWHMDGDGRHFGIDWRSRQGNAAEMISGKIPTPVGGTLVVTRDAFEAIGGFSPEIPILVDFEFALRLALRGDLVYIDELLIGYRRHSMNMTSTVQANVRLRRNVMEEMIDRQRWAAIGRGENLTAELFSKRLRAHRDSEARRGGQAVYRLMRRRDFRNAQDEIVWGLSRAPGDFVAAALAAPVSKGWKVGKARWTKVARSNE